MSKVPYSKSILGLANQIRRLYNIFTKNNGAQSRILYFILEKDSERDIFQKDIEEEMSICSSGISTILKKMEEQRMIKREKVPYDDRLKKIRPTALALNMKDKIDSEIEQIEGQLTSGIEKEQLDIFSNVLYKMVENMSRKEE